MVMSQLDADQVIKSVFNSDVDALRVAPSAGTLVKEDFDYVSMALSAGDTVETYTYKLGGSGGTTVATVVVTYTTNARSVLVSVAKT
jgi:hypothetical protein